MGLTNHSGANLSLANLSDADLSYAILLNAYLGDAHLGGSCCISTPPASRNSTASRGQPELC